MAERERMPLKVEARQQHSARSVIRHNIRTTNKPPRKYLSNILLDIHLYASLFIFTINKPSALAQKKAKKWCARLRGQHVAHRPRLPDSGSDRDTVAFISPNFFLFCFVICFCFASRRSANYSRNIHSSTNRPDRLNKKPVILYILFIYIYRYMETKKKEK